MTYLARIASLIAMAATGLSLSGCSSGPSDAEMLKAVQSQAAAERQAFEQFAGKGAAGMVQRMQGDIKELKKIGCKEDGEKAYRCDVEIEVQQGGATHKGPTSMRFVKGSNGWAVMK